ncbi:MAG: uL15 family ribosomal protein [archaeon]|jgi:ribosomal protein L15
MVERTRRKKNKVRGERTHGQGDTKNNRGAGCRGGRGRAGADKGKFASLGRLDARKYKLKAAIKGKIISLANLDIIIDRLVAKGKVVKEKDSYIIDSDSGYEKILSQGNTDKKLIVRINATDKAIEKIKKAKGKFEFNKKNLVDAEPEFDDDEDFEASEEKE